MPRFKIVAVIYLGAMLRRHVTTKRTRVLTSGATLRYFQFFLLIYNFIFYKASVA